MNCSETKFVMPLYLSSELDATPMAEFELHVQRCGPCARELEYTRHCDELLRDACLEQPVDTSGLRERVLSEISKSIPRRRFLFRRPVYSLPIAAVLLLHGGAQNAHTWDTVLIALGRAALALMKLAPA